MLLRPFLQIFEYLLELLGVDHLVDLLVQLVQVLLPRVTLLALLEYFAVGANLREVCLVVIAREVTHFLLLKLDGVGLSAEVAQSLLREGLLVAHSGNSYAYRVAAVAIYVHCILAVLAREWRLLLIMEVILASPFRIYRVVQLFLEIQLHVLGARAGIVVRGVRRCVILVAVLVQLRVLVVPLQPLVLDPRQVAGSWPGAALSGSGRVL